MSADGRYVVFTSDASNLVPDDVNGVSDVFLHDRQTHVTELISVTAAGGHLSAASSGAAVSGDGRYVAFSSAATDLVPGDAPADRRQVYVRDRQNGTVERLSVALQGAPGSTDSSGPAITPDGRHLAFESSADNLVPGDTNGITDVFVAPTTAAAPSGEQVLMLGTGQSVSGVDFGDHWTAGYDFGDAPDPGYPTLFASNGAWHPIVAGLCLGSAIDEELDGQPTAGADGDDANGAADEDGVTFGAMRVGQLAASVTVNVQGAPDGAKLDAWIDFDGDGCWGGAWERIAYGTPVVEGDNVITFDVPSWAADGTTYARFRLSTPGNLGPGVLRRKRA